MTLSFEGWLNGISSMVALISFCVFGMFFIYKSRRTDAKLLFHMGLAGIFQGLAFIGACVDFLTILLTDNNMDNTHGLRGILGYMWMPFLGITMVYIGTELLIQKNKRYIISIYSVLAVLLELLIFFDSRSSFKFIYPKSPGENLIDTQFALGSPASIIYFVVNLSIIILWGFGFLYKSFKSKGILKKKFLLLSIGTFYTLILSLVLVLLSNYIITFLARFGVISGIIFYYFGLREEPEKIEKTSSKKEVKVEESLFRISQRPDQITEEEVTISKEKKICIVCKGKVFKLLYMCQNCNTFYCVKCSDALSKTENACWVCNEPFDESKPSKPYIDEKEDIKIPSEEDSSEKAKKS